MHSNTPDIKSFAAPIKYEVLTEDQINALKKATLHLISEVGIRFPSQIALQTFSDHGAQVDWESEIVRISPELVHRALSTAPRSFILGGREERFDLTLDGSRSYLATDGCG
ncbi:MAG: trimethylamine methyltransferase family protein, partial [Anaerolineales bacterium]